MTARIVVDRVTLDVPIFVQRERPVGGWGSLLMGAAFEAPKRRYVRLLDDISFELEEGDRLAILGRNGAGKSTLLRVLNQVYQPSGGSLHVQGSRQALLNMSLGFSSEATVQENIFLRGIAMGLKYSFLRRESKAILEFSDLEDKATHRLRTLSSGQKMRLGFAISTSVQNDIILMDEWVGAGDAEFMKKATERMQDRVGGSKILVLASHSIGLLRTICNQGIVLDAGKLIHCGDIVSALARYHALMEEVRVQEVESAQTGTATTGGDGGIYGCAESIVFEGGAFIVTGWMVDTAGQVPDSVILSTSKGLFAAHAIAHVQRKDVARHMGLVNDRCGFRASLRIPGSSNVEELGGELEVLGGRTPEGAQTRLRLGPAIRHRLPATSVQKS